MKRYTLNRIRSNRKMKHYIQYSVRLERKVVEYGYNETSDKDLMDLINELSAELKL